MRAGKISRLAVQQVHCHMLIVLDSAGYTHQQCRLVPGRSMKFPLRPPFIGELWHCYIVITMHLAHIKMATWIVWTHWRSLNWPASRCVGSYGHFCGCLERPFFKPHRNIRPYRRIFLYEYMLHTSKTCAVRRKVGVKRSNPGKVTLLFGAVSPISRKAREHE